MIKKLLRIILAVFATFAVVFTFAACGCSADGSDGEKAAASDDKGEVSSDTEDYSSVAIILPEDDISDLNGVEDGTDTASDTSGTEESGQSADVPATGPADSEDGAESGEPAETTPRQGQNGQGEDPVGTDSGPDSDPDEIQDPAITLPGGSGEPIELPFDPFD